MWSSRKKVRKRDDTTVVLTLRDRVRSCRPKGSATNTVGMKFHARVARRIKLCNLCELKVIPADSAEFSRSPEEGTCADVRASANCRGLFIPVPIITEKLSLIAAFTPISGVGADGDSSVVESFSVSETVRHGTLLSQKTPMPLASE